MYFSLHATLMYLCTNRYLYILNYLCIEMFKFHLYSRYCILYVMVVLVCVRYFMYLCILCILCIESFMFTLYSRYCILYVMVVLVCVRYFAKESWGRSARPVIPASSNTATNSRNNTIITTNTTNTSRNISVANTLKKVWGRSAD